MPRIAYDTTTDAPYRVIWTYMGEGNAGRRYVIQDGVEIAVVDAIPDYDEELFYDAEQELFEAE